MLNNQSDVLHVVLTAFNLRYAGQARDALSESWLSDRFDLFERYCLPSMQNQTHQNFYWLIYFDEGTSAKYRERIREYQKYFPNLIVKWVDRFPKHRVASDILPLIKKHHRWLLSTRLDNDDGLHNRFSEKLRSEVKNHLGASDSFAFNFAKGVILSKDKIYVHEDFSNPFCSLLEPISVSDKICKTVLAVQHNDIPYHFRTHQIMIEPMWLQVVHDRNIRNRVKGKRVSDLNLSGFSTLKKRRLKLHPGTVRLENLTLGVFRYIFEYLVNLSRKFKK